MLEETQTHSKRMKDASIGSSEPLSRPLQQALNIKAPCNMFADKAFIAIKVRKETRFSTHRWSSLL
jgi:hypothetical protein